MASLLPNTDAERQLVVALLAGEVRPAFARDLLDQMSATREATEHITEQTKDNESSTELTPEQIAFMGVILARFDANKHGISCHTPENRAKLEAKLRANPAKLDALKKMDDTGGAPDVTGVEGEEFLFDDLAAKLPDSRRDVNYAQAVAKAEAMGAGVKLTHPYRYNELGNKLNIVMDIGGDWVWLDTSYLKDVLDAGAAIYGRRYNGHCYVYQRDASFHLRYGAFRCSLRV